MGYRFTAWASHKFCISLVIHGRFSIRATVAPHGLSHRRVADIFAVDAVAPG
jgi:hypothetical protein